MKAVGKKKSTFSDYFFLSILEAGASAVALVGKDRSLLRKKKRFSGWINSIFKVNNYTTVFMYLNKYFSPDYALLWCGKKE